MKTILVTGGLGYIGSHVCVELMTDGFTPVIIDNLCNSDISTLDNIEKITGVRPQFYQNDIRDGVALSNIFDMHDIDCVMHFAGLKAVGESVEKPILYYQNNVEGTLCLLEAMNSANVKKIIFSSSATVYGEPPTLPINEDMPTGQVTNPYGRSKYMVEEVLKDLHTADSAWSISLLRYFNPVGAHESGFIGESPRGIPNNLMPYIAMVANGDLPSLSVFGDDYDTVDGTGVRDYIHVVDLAKGHIAALTHKSTDQGVHIYNLGTGQGHSVLEVLKAYKNASQKAIPYTIQLRRDGDIAASWASPDKAKSELHWKATKTLQDMVIDSWRWISKSS